MDTPVIIAIVVAVVIIAIIIAVVMSRSGDKETPRKRSGTPGHRSDGPRDEGRERARGRDDDGPRRPRADREGRVDRDDRPDRPNRPDRDDRR